MLRFNTFRAQRYLRSRFVEGRFLLASEATDIELELIDSMRTVVREIIGDVAIEDAWKVERLTDTELLIKPGEAWINGLPVFMRNGKDHLVSGASLTLGIIPLGVTITDDATGLGKVLKFNDGATTPSGNYRIVVAVRDEVITSTTDLNLKNVNLTEDTAQKVRLNFQLNIVLESDQTETSEPYANDNTDENLVNRIVVSPTAAGNGELLATNLISGSEGVDGRDLELIVRNDPGVGAGNPFPNSVADQQVFFTGRLIDSTGNVYYVNAIFNDTVSTQLVIRIDKEVNQPNPVITNGTTYILEKGDVYATDSANGNALGKFFWPIANLNWDSTDGVVHESKVIDLRNSINKLEEFQAKTNQKYILHITDGGDVDFASPTLTWSSDVTLINPTGPDQTISAASAPLLDGGSLAYALDLAGGGALEKGTLAVTVTGAGATISLAAVDSSAVEVGNVLQLGAELVEITDIDNVNDTMGVSPAIVGTGAATIYLDSYAAGKAPLSLNSFCLAVRKGSKVYVAGALELEDGEESQIGDGISAQLLTFMGASGETDDSPSYSSTNVVSNGDSLVTAIGKLDSSSGGSATDKLIEDRNVFLREGGDLTFTGTSLTMTEALKLHLDQLEGTNPNAPGPLIIDIGSTSRAFSADARILYAVIDRSAGTAAITADATSVPATSNQEVFILAKRVDTGGGLKRLYFRDGTVLDENQTAKLGAAMSNELLTFMGAADFSDSDPNYTSTNVVTQGNSLSAAISELDVVAGVSAFAQYDLVVGSAADVTAGTATHSSIAAAITASAANDTILILNSYSSTENITVSKTLNIHGQGYGSFVDGTVTFDANSDNSLMRNLRVAGLITLAAGADGVQIDTIWSDQTTSANAIDIDNTVVAEYINNIGLA